MARSARVFAIALFAALGSFLFGLDIGYIGPIVESSYYKENVAHIVGDAKIPSGLEGLIVSLFSIGAIVMAFPVVSSYWLDTWGRKVSIMVGASIFIAGSALQASANGVPQMLAGRFVAGLSVGLLSNVVVLYQSELAPAHLRGALSTLYQLMITFGILVAAFMDQLLVEREGGWRLVIWLLCLPALVLVVGMAFLPRSPRWLVQVGRTEDALRVLRSIRSEEDAAEELEDAVREKAADDAMGKPRWAELFQGKVGRLLLLGVTLQLLQQLVGMNAFMYFGPKIFENIGFDKNLFTTINNFVNFLATIPAVMLADVLGRRTLLLSSGVGMSLACLLMGVVGGIYSSKDANGTWELSSEGAGWVVACSVFFFVFNFAYGFGPIVWTYVAEIFPMKYRARCVALCTTANWVGNFIIAEFTPVLLERIGFWTFLVFGLFCMVGVLLAAWLPETKGVPLEVVGELFDEKYGFRGLSRGKQAKADAEEDSKAAVAKATGEEEEPAEVSV